jgi:hypothetical protein
VLAGQTVSSVQCAEGSYNPAGSMSPCTECPYGERCAATMQQHSLQHKLPGAWFRWRGVLCLAHTT